MEITISTFRGDVAIGNTTSQLAFRVVLRSLHRTTVCVISGTLCIGLGYDFAVLIVLPYYNHSSYRYAMRTRIICYTSPDGGPDLNGLEKGRSATCLM